MYFTQNGKIKDSKDFTALQSVAGNPNMDWTDERVDLFMNQADGIISTNNEACQLATSCLELNLGNKLLSHFAQKLGIADLDVLKMYLSAIANEKAMKNKIGSMVGPILGKALMGAKREEVDLDSLHQQFKNIQQEAYQTQTDIVTAAADVLAIPANADLDQIGKIAQIGDVLIAGSKERLLLEEATTDEALPHLRSIYDVSHFADMIESSTGACTLIAAYAQEKLDYFPNAALLLGMIDGPTKILPDDLAAMVNSVRLIIYDTATELLGKNGHEATLGQLKHFAHAIRPIKDDGSDTARLEDTINSIAIKIIDNSQAAAKMAGAYKTKSGKHRFLAAYLASLDGKPFTQEDLDVIACEVRSMTFGGADVFTKLAELAKRHNLEFDEREALQNLRRPQLPPALEALLSGKGECDCVDCQLQRLVEQDPANSCLADEWEEAKEKLASAGVIKILGERRFAYSGNTEKFEKSMEILGLSEALRNILRKSFDPQRTSDFPPEIAMMLAQEDGFPGEAFSIEVVVHNTSSPKMLREELEKHLQAGDLATYKLMTNGGPMTVKEMAAIDPDVVQPELLEIAKEYAAKIT